MIGISFWRIIKAALQNFWRNVWLSAATTVIMTMTLMMIASLYFANIFGAQVLQNIERKVDLSVNFKETATDEYLGALSSELKARDDVADVRVVTSDEAVEIFRKQHEDNPLIEESLQELGENPLPASMYIVAESPQFYEAIAEDLRAEKYQVFVEEVNFKDTEDVIEKLVTLIDSVKNVGLVVTIIFVVLVVLIMFNTVRLAIYSFREEIEIMRLVGASRWFIQGPFIVEAIIVSLLALGVTIGISFPVLKAISPQLSRFFFDVGQEQLDLYQYALNNGFSFVGWLLLAALGLAIVSSAIAVRRYLRD